MEQQQALKIAVTGATTLALDTLTPFQGDLKTLSKERYEQLRKNLIDEGLSLVLHVWQEGGVNYIIDGHQRVTALKMMRDNEGWLIPEVPVSLVIAPDFASAKRKVLSAVAQYGEMSETALKNYIIENNIPMELVVTNYSFQNFNMDKFKSLFSTEVPVSIEAPAGEAVAPDMKVSSDGVRQVQLFFDNDSHVEFMTKIEFLTKAYGKENVTDVVLECVREAHNNRPQIPQ